MTPPVTAVILDETHHFADHQAAVDAALADELAATGTPSELMPHGEVTSAAAFAHATAPIGEALRRRG